MAEFKKTTQIVGKIKNVIATEDGFIDDETGENVDVCQLIRSVYSDTPVTISVSYKSEDAV